MNDRQRRGRQMNYLPLGMEFFLILAMAGVVL